MDAFPNIVEFAAKVEHYLDSIVDTGTEQELFIAGYLHGHFSLVVSQIESDGNDDKQRLDSAMLNSLQQAFEQGELEQDDQQQVFALWQKLREITV